MYLIKFPKFCVIWLFIYLYPAGSKSTKKIKKIRGTRSFWQFRVLLLTSKSDGDNLFQSYDIRKITIYSQLYRESFNVESKRLTILGTWIKIHKVPCLFYIKIGCRVNKNSITYKLIQDCVFASLLFNIEKHGGPC